MRELHNKLMQLDRRNYDPDILQLIDMIVWKLDEYENRITNLDRVLQNLMFREMK